MAIDREFIEEYKQLLILQYSDSPNAVAEIELLMSTWSRVFDFLNNFVDEFDIDQAYGDRLDKIGAIVGINRIVPESVLKQYFGFASNPNAKTFGEGPLLNLLTDSVYTDTQLNDTQYRFFIKSKIAKNITSAYSVSDDRVSLLDTINFMFNGGAYVIDNQDMSLTLYIDFIYSVADINVYLGLDLLPKPQGVRYKNFIHYDSDNTFGFASNPNAKGFGAGKFAVLLSI